MFTIKINLSSARAALLLGLIAISGKAIAQGSPKKVPARQDTVLIPPPIGAAEVNIGYLGLKRKEVTAAVSQVADSRFNQLANVSITSLLQGQVAGLKIVNTSGVPGSGALLTIRGTSTLNAGTAPLFIIDGIPVKSDRFVDPLTRNVDNDPMADINPADIESVMVLKDAASTALYGMRGANGVILINTYGGTNGKTLLDFSGFSGIMEAPARQDVFNAAQYRGYIIEKERARGLSDAQINSGIGRYLLLSTRAGQVERYNNDTDWQDQVTARGLYNDYHLNLRGGDAVSKYSLNVGYTTTDGGIQNTNFNRFSTRFNLDYKVGRKLSFLNSLSYTKTGRDVRDEGNATNTNPLFLSALKSPVLAVFKQDQQGNDLRDLDSADYAGRNNPYSIINRMRGENSTNRITGKIVGQYTFTPYLNLKIGVSGDYYRLNEARFRPSAGFLPESYIIRSSAEKNSTEMMVNNENVLTYVGRSNSGRHSFTAFIGNAFQVTSQDTKYAVTVNSNSDEFGGINTSDQKSLDSIGSFSPSWRLMSFFAGAQYALKSRYLFGANVRADGSSRFAKGKQWGYFPSVSAAWRIGAEPFMGNIKTLSELKLRTSYGLSGNQEVGYYNGFNVLTSANYSDYAGIRIGSLGNPDFTWEETAQFNIGLDLGLLKDRVNITADYYVKKTKNLYNTIRLPGTSGFSTYAISEGSVKNNGFELGVSAKILRGKFSWQANLNAAHNKNEITSLPNLFTSVENYGDFSGILTPGSSVGSFFGYKALGVYKSSADVKLKNGTDNLVPFQGGDIIFEDRDGNGIIDQADRQVIGKVSPDYYGGFSNLFSYRNFDLNIFMDFAVGNQVYNAQRAALESMSNYDNQSISTLGRWQKEDDITDMPRLLHGDPVGNTRFSSRWIESGSYARIKAVTVGYNLPLKGKFKRIFSNARILLTGQNLYTFSDYKGLNPELASVTNPIMYGLDYGNVPQMRSILLGLKLGL
jgi:TonB-linked SusC/RagA family outer membrane protein